VDYLVGFTLSPVLWRKLPGCRSAGRVQSVALRLVADREEEVAAFTPQEHWSLNLELAGQAGKADKDAGDGQLQAGLVASVSKLRGQSFDPKVGGVRAFSLVTADAAEAAVAALRAQREWTVGKVERKKSQKGPLAPYNTASLQMDASRRLSLPVGIVMRMAQTLYEGVELRGERRGLITYMRTDGTQMSTDAVEAVRAYIGATYGAGLETLPASAREYTTKKKNAQEAHEAIRPVDFSVTPQELRTLAPGLDEKEQALYELVWRRAVASQMANSVYDQLRIKLSSAEDDEAAASASVLAQPGFRAVSLRKGEEDAGGAAPVLPAELAALSVGDVLPLRDVLPTQHFTEPPPRFSEGSLVKRLEELGVGRPSTYSSIMKVRARAWSTEA
jgi:DNA topoisomerase-1